MANVLIIIIDDDDISNMVSSLTIKGTWPEVDVMTFLSPVAAWEFLRNDFMEQQEYEHVVMMLNIHMPIINGWEFLDLFESLGQEVKERIIVYILSSSIDIRDEEKARVNKYVRRFLSKPLTAESVLALRENTNP